MFRNECILVGNLIFWNTKVGKSLHLLAPRMVSAESLCMRSHMLHVPRSWRSIYFNPFLITLQSFCDYYCYYYCLFNSQRSIDSSAWCELESTYFAYTYIIRCASDCVCVRCNCRIIVIQWHLHTIPIGAFRVDSTSQHDAYNLYGVMCVFKFGRIFIVQMRIWSVAKCTEKERARGESMRITHSKFINTPRNAHT